MSDSRFGAMDDHFFAEGSHLRLFDKLGAQLVEGGVHFAVWAPNARTVSVIGDWNGWDGNADPLQPRWDGSGIWEAFVAAARCGQAYKYRIASASGAPIAD